jgi:septal ring factor EnvC (AmiA/AmiB activator)
MTKKLLLSLVILTACSSVAFADGNAFTPLNFDDASYGVRTSATSTAVSTPVVTSNTTTETAGSSNMQNAITQLDSAQVEVRNELLNYKTKYSDIDAQYTAIKAERKALGKQVKTLEKKISKIDKQKENIRKNMQ